MKRFVIATVIAFLATSMAFGLEVILSTGQIKLPNYDGTFSNISISDRAGIFLCLTDVAAYQTYAEDSAGLYQAWQDGDFDSETYQYLGNTSNDGEQIVRFSCNQSDFFYAIAIATYDSTEYNCSYYIARALSKEYSGNDPLFDVVPFVQTIASANSWSIVPEPTTASLIVLGIITFVVKRKVT